MHTRVPIPGEPYKGEPILLGVDLAAKPDAQSWSLVYIGRDGAEIIGCGLGVLTEDEAKRLVAQFTPAAERAGGGFVMREADATSCKPD